MSDYLVRGATLECTSGSAPRKLNLPLCHGVYSTHHPMCHKMDNVPNVNIMPFGICKVTGEPCMPVPCGPWNKYHRTTFVTGQEAITMESFLVCAIGGLIEPTDCGQGLIEVSDIDNDAVKKELQKEEYKKMYGKDPSDDDLNDLHFITDLRLNGKDDILFLDQLKRSQSLYNIAQNYPDYYKLDEKYGLGTDEYNEQLEAFRKKINWDRAIKEASGDYLLYDADAYLNGIVEQSICEIKRKDAEGLASINNERWDKFTDQINNVVQSIGTIPSVSGTIPGFPIQGNLSEIVHYERNAFNRAPSTLKGLEENPIGWSLFEPDKAIYHMNGDDGEYNLKFVSDNGKYEAIYNKDGVLLTEFNDPNNMSTYNYGPPVAWYNGYVEHYIYDMEPYYDMGGYPDFPAINADGNEAKFLENEDAKRNWNEKNDSINKRKEELS